MAKQMATPTKQTFRFSSPTAVRVLLVGDFTHWQQRGIPMQRGKDGTWAATVTLPPGKHNYRFIVDGDWQDHPECILRVPNPYGGENMIRQVS